MCGTVRRMFELKVKQITGEVLTVELENGTESFVHEVKAKIASLTGVESDRQRLIFTGRVLKDEDRLKDYGISNESMIQYVVRPQDTPIVPPNSTERASATTEPIVQQFRNLGNGVVMGSITLDSSNLSRENLPLQDIIGQVMNLAQTFLPPSNTTNRQNTPSSGHSQPIPQAESPRPQPLASSSIQITQSSPSSTQIHSPSESLAAAHLDAVLQLIPNQTSPTNPNLAAILNQLFRVLNALQVPIVNLSRDLPQTFNGKLITMILLTSNRFNGRRSPWQHSHSNDSAF